MPKKDQDHSAESLNTQGEAGGAIDPAQIDAEARAARVSGFSEFERGEGDAGQTEVQEAMDEATEQGFIGEKADPVPNEAYTVSGVTKGLRPEQVANKGAEK